MLLTETLKQTEKMSKQEFQTLFFHVLQIASEKYNMGFVLKNIKKNNKNGKAKPIFGVWKNEISISDDFNEPLEDFNDYM